jgi:hypothetical protein
MFPVRVGLNSVDKLDLKVEQAHSSCRATRDRPTRDPGHDGLGVTSDVGPTSHDHHRVLLAAHSPAIFHGDSVSVELRTVTIEKFRIVFVYT